MSSENRKRLWCGSAVAIANAWTSVLTAQAATNEPAAARSGSGLEELVVTAQRRAENLQDVPISIAAFSQEAITARGITDSLDVAALVPGLVINKNIGAAVPWLRGVGSISSGFGTEMPVASYIDGFYLPNPAAGLFSVNNIERIEVLKGPQGTLFGRNASAGVIQVITRDPDPVGKVDATIGYGNYDTYSGSFYGTMGLTPGLAANLSASHSDQGDGWGRNAFTGSDIFKTRQTNVQAKLQWTAGAQTTITLQAIYDERRSDVGIQYGIAPGSFGVDGTPFLDNYVVANRQDRVGKADQGLIGLKIEQGVGFADLVSLTGYNRINSEFSFNQSGLPGSPVAGQGAVEIELDGDGETFTQELQLLSRAGSSVDWIVGLFYLDDRQGLEQIVHGTCVGATCVPPIPVLVHGRQDSNSYSAFGQATFGLWSNARLTTGLRYTVDEKSIEDGFAEPGPGFPNSPTTLPPGTLPFPGAPYPGNPNGIDPSEEWEKLTWRVALDQELTEDILAYVSYNRGFKSGTFNITAFNNPPARPEVLDAYEIGLKTTLVDNKLRFNIAAFYYDYQDIQLRTTAPPAVPGQTILFNAAKSTLQGVDIDLQFAPSSDFSINAGVSLLDAEYDSFVGASCVTPRPVGGAVLGGNVATICDRSGTTMIRSPKVAGTVGFTVGRRTAIGELSFSANDTYTSRFYWEPSSRLEQDPYHYVSASFTWTSLDDRLNVQLWGKNLADESFYTASFEGANDTYSPSDPLTYGVRLGIHF